ncbi:ankyrin repeat domain-containing protein [Burkholderia vietnamiensis]|nr:ankyrin repeat domain-containing protein [Burkholderia vietnamiensis]
MSRPSGRHRMAGLPLNLGIAANRIEVEGSMTTSKGKGQARAIEAIEGWFANMARETAAKELFDAVRRGDPEAVALWAPEAGLDARDAQGNTALMIATSHACAGRGAECVRALLPHSDPLSPDAHGRSAFWRAVVHGLPKTAIALIGHATRVELEWAIDSPRGSEMLSSIEAQLARLARESR